MYCTKCGTALVPGNQFCTQCGSSILQVNANNTTSVAVPVQIVDDGDRKANLWCIISIVLYFLGPSVVGILGSFLSNVSESLGTIFAFLSLVPRLVAYGLMIMARVKYPDNKFAKILMWVYIVLFGLGVVIFVIAIIFILALVGSFM